MPAAREDSARHRSLLYTPAGFARRRGVPSNIFIDFSDTRTRRRQPAPRLAL